MLACVLAIWLSPFGPMARAHVEGDAKVFTNTTLEHIRVAPVLLEMTSWKTEKIPTCEMARSTVDGTTRQFTHAANMAWPPPLVSKSLA